MTRHVWAREHLASFIAGGLSTEERSEIEELLKSDAGLAAAYEELRGVDGRLRQLFAAATPPSAAALEDRLIRALRQTSPNTRASKLTAPAKWMMIAASVLLVVFAGSTAFVVMDEMSPVKMTANGRLLPLSPRTFTPNALSVEGLEDLSRSSAASDVVDLFFLSREKEDLSAGETYKRQSSLTGGIIGGTRTYDFDTKEGQPRESAPNLEGRDGGKLKEKFGAPSADGTSWEDEAKAALRASEIKNGTDFGYSLDSGLGRGAGIGTGGGSGPGAGMSTYSPPPAGVPGSVPSVAGGDPGKDASKYKGYFHWGRLRPEDKGEKSLAEVHIMQGVTERGTRVFTIPTKPGDDAPVATSAARPSVPSPTAPPSAVEPAVQPAAAPPPPGSQPPPGMTPAATPAQAKAPDAFDPAKGLSKLLAGLKDGAREGDDVDKNKGDLMDGRLGDSKKELPSLNLPDGEKEKDTKKLDDLKEELTLGKRQDDPKDPKAEPGKVPPEKIDPKIDPKVDPKIDPKFPPKTAQKRVIIRSGDIDFEVDSFDQAVDTIYKLISKTQGGIVATTNSDKLSNGKMRGTIVVRMPPEELDDFVFALRRDLGKFGELKNQRIGSQDVTKQYTDMESELRGLRVSEDRLIQMLKDVKAQLKDLLAVETQLANTRTRIERIEGELRYYANLAAMSTLTINLNEKEIRVAAGVVESERVQAGIESEDVDKAFQEAKAAIDEFKGRVFHSELKQSANGQYNALLQFDVAPESAGQMRDRLKQIGVLARLEIDRVQKVEGGGQPTRESKIKKGDTQFYVSIYNLANFTPRETVQATIVGVDVPASYRKLRELLGKLKSNVWNTSLQNVDAQNVLGVLDFDIRRVDESVVQTALAEAGDVLSRKVDRSADTDRTTDTKVRYNVRLRSVGNVTARETNNMSLAAVDVPASFRKVRDAVVKAKGYIRTANLAETEKATTAATLIFDVMRADEAALLATLTEVGEVLTRRVDRRADGEEVTDAKVGFSVTLVSVASLPARESNTLTIAVVDVAEAFQAIRNVVRNSKSVVHKANLQEIDRQKTEAVLSFDVLRGDEEAVKAALVQAGEKLSSESKRQAAGGQVTDAKVEYDVRIVSVNSIDPRSIYGVSLQVDDVGEKLRAINAIVKDVQGRVVSGPTSDNSAGTVVARVSYLVPLTSGALVAEDIRKLGTVVLLDEKKNPQAPDGKLALAQINVTLSSEVVKPRDTHKIAIQTDDVGEKLKTITNLVTAAGGKTVAGPVSSTNNGVVESKVAYTLPLAAGLVVVEEIKKVGKVVFQKDEQDLKAPEGKMALARIEVTLSNTVLVPADEGFWSQVRGGLAISVRGLSLSASILIVAILFIGPWLLLIWAVTWMIRRYFVTQETPATPGTPVLAAEGPAPSAPGETPKA